MKENRNMLSDDELMKVSGGELSQTVAKGYLTRNEENMISSRFRIYISEGRSFAFGFEQAYQECFDYINQKREATRNTQFSKSTFKNLCKTIWKENGGTL